MTHRFPEMFPHVTEARKSSSNPASIRNEVVERGGGNKPSAGGVIESLAHVKPPALQLRRRSGNSLYDYPSRYSSKRFLQAKRQKQQKYSVHILPYTGE